MIQTYHKLAIESRVDDINRLSTGLMKQWVEYQSQQHQAVNNPHKPKYVKFYDGVKNGPIPKTATHFIIGIPFNELHSFYATVKFPEVFYSPEYDIYLTNETLS